MTNNKNILVLGIEGMLGHVVGSTLSERFNVIGTTRNTLHSKSEIRQILPKLPIHEGLDIRDANSVKNLIQAFKPDYVINCVGVIKQKMGPSSFLDCIEINSALPHRLSSICEENGSRLIHFSTDCVFSCKPGVKDLLTPPDPQDLYGRSKLLGELDHENSLTLRTSIVGRQISGSESLFEWLLGQKGKSISGYTQALYTGMTTKTLAKIVQQIIESETNLHGVWQVASSEISKYDLLQLVNEKLNLGISIEKNSDFECDRRLDGSEFTRRTSISVPSWNTMIEEFKSDQEMYRELDALI
jgi:dTDP-4-dehydrorhamnose reductase